MNLTYLLLHLLVSVYCADLPKRIAFIGTPVSGKGTLTKWLSQNYGPFPIISTGNLLRMRQNEEGPVGEAIRAMFKDETNIKEEMVMGMLVDELKRIGSEIWCLDGFPRTLNQARSFDNLLAKIGSSLDLVISVEVPDTEIIRRVADRWVHLPSGRTYSLSFNPPLQPGLDDVTGEPLVKRMDDQTSILEGRLAFYHKSKEAILSHYEQSGRLIRLSGTDSKELYRQLKESLHNRQ